MSRLKTSTSMVLLLCAIPSASLAISSSVVRDAPPAVHEERQLLRSRLDAAAAEQPEAAHDLSVAQWNNWSNWTNFWNNWNNWANW